MAVIIAPPPRPNPFGRGLMQAADAFASQAHRSKERKERDKIVRRETVNDFILKALPQAQTEDQVRRFVSIYEENNGLGAGFFGPESIAAIASGNRIDQEMKKVEKAGKEATTNLIGERTKAVSAGILTEAAREGRAEEAQAFGQEQARARTAREFGAETRAGKTAEQQIAESQERVKGLRAKREAEPKKPRAVDIEKDILAQSNIDFFNRTGSTREEYIEFFGAEDFDPFTAGPDGGPMTAEQIVEFNSINEEFKLGLPLIEVTGRGLRRMGPEFTTKRAPTVKESPAEFLKRVKGQTGTGQ